MPIAVRLSLFQNLHYLGIIFLFLIKPFSDCYFFLGFIVSNQVYVVLCVYWPLLEPFELGLGRVLRDLAHFLNYNVKFKIELVMTLIINHSVLLILIITCWFKILLGRFPPRLFSPFSWFSFEALPWPSDHLTLHLWHQNLFHQKDLTLFQN